MNRREFAGKSLMATAMLTTFPFSGYSVTSGTTKIKKGIMWGSIGVGETILEKFVAAKIAGFEGVEPLSHLNRDEVISAAVQTGMKIPSVCGALHWEYPLAHSDPAIREKGVEALIHSLEDAKSYGADTVLLVPGRVTADLTYDECWSRSVDEIRKVIPVAEKMKVKIAIENVWNNFLLSPLEAARYVDQFESRYAGFYFDCGNILAYGWPEQWIRILGDRIAKVHIKEYSLSIANSKGRSAGFNVDLLEGDVNWKAVMKALSDIGYNDWAIIEQRGGNTPEGLADLAFRLGKILES